MVFRVKICGITNIVDAQAAVAAGADAIGLNFYRQSRRYVSPSEARSIVEAVAADADVVGVFVNAPAEEIRQISRDVGLHLIQLHGDEPPELLRHLNKDHDIIRARRLDSRGIDAIVEDFEACCMAAGFGPDAILVDAALPGEYGGTGRTADWQRLAGFHDRLLDLPLILAGGLTPTNVAEAIQVVRPQAVDVASGVESSPGKKDPLLVREFVAAAQTAFAN
jgi:phosphoribosylanthranilate isomerase